MFKKILPIIVCIFFQPCFAVTFQVKSTNELENNAHYSVYTSPEFTLIAHVITLPIDDFDIKLTPALGQREEVTSMAKRSHAFIAVNGSNYRRGGKYNGDRVNLCYLNHAIYADLQLLRGSFGWNSKTKTAIIDTCFLHAKLFINNNQCPVDQINQPRTLGKSTLYTDRADIFLLAHRPGKNILINADGIIEDITYELPNTIPTNGYVYQVDKDAFPDIEKGMKTEFTFEIKSSDDTSSYNDHDFILGGAGLLLQKEQIVSDHLYTELSQGTEIVHCADEVAADFHTKEMQEWLIEKRHPRTALGITHDNQLCIVVVDGRLQESEGA